MPREIERNRNRETKLDMLARKHIALAEQTQNRLTAATHSDAVFRAAQLINIQGRTARGGQ